MNLTNGKNRMKKMLLLMLVGLTPFFMTGCFEDGGASKKVSKVKIPTEFKTICMLPNSMYKGDMTVKEENRVKFISVKFESEPVKGLLGGKGKSVGVAGIDVELSVTDGSGITLWDAKEQKELESAILTSDAGGLIRFRIKTGSVLGEQAVKIKTLETNENPKSKSSSIRIVNGITLLGVKQTGATESTLENKVGVMLKDADNKPIVGAKAYFRVLDTPEKLLNKRKAKISSSAITNEEGVAEVSFKVGKKTGTYKLIAEVSHKDITTRAIEIEQYGLNLTGVLNGGLIVTVLGGLAIFVFGMKLMGDGLQMVAGEKMKSILQFFAKNRIVAVIAGALVTGVIQSSSACTVMVVGFVNAGLLNLTQAIGIVFGANIGTTITAQMIAFKLSNLALPAVILGLVIVMLAKKMTIKGWGQTVLGFGLLFYGMSIMSGQLKAIGSFPQFVEFFQRYDCTPEVMGGGMPLGNIVSAIAIGALITVAIQSSSASMGIVLALTTSGLVSFYTAVPLILGTNIGTTITAVLASIGTNERAKQTAAAHVIFNLLGSAIMIALFFVPWGDAPVFLTFVNSVTPGDALSLENPENVMRHTAMAHTFFNVTTVILFIPLIGIIARICNVIIKVKDEVKINYLEPHLLDTPSIALEQSIRSVSYMTKEAWEMIQESVGTAFLDGKIEEEALTDLAQREEKVDELQEDLSSYLVQLTSRELTQSQAELIPLLMHCNNDAESIADHSESIIGLAKRLAKSDNKFSEGARKELNDIWTVMIDQAVNVLEGLNNTDQSNINFAIKDKRKIYSMCSDAERKHVKRLMSGECSVVTGVIFIEMLSELERLGSKFSNIAERTAQIQEHHVILP